MSEKYFKAFLTYFADDISLKTAELMFVIAFKIVSYLENL